MQCSVCRKQPATVTLKHVVNGEQKDFSVCQECAAKHGLDSQLPIPLLTDLLFGAAVGRLAPADNQACTGCHMHQADFHKTSLLGCPACYQAFSGEIACLVRNMHRGTRHFGKIPRRHLAAYVRALEQAISDADPARDVEALGHLRHHLRQLVRPAAPEGRGRGVGAEMDLEA